MIKTSCAVAFMLMITGCATNRYDAQLHSIERPTLVIECPESGCQFSKLAYTDPRDRPQHTNANDAYIQTIKTIGGVITAVAPFWAITNIIAPSITNTSSNSLNSNTITNTAATNTTTTSTTLPPIIGVE